jgi:uncharacterized GH25 family protein
LITSSLRGSQFSWFFAVLATGLLSASFATAHDFWIEPQTFRPSVGAKVPLRLHVGNDFKGDLAIFNPEQFERYVVSGPAGEKPVAGMLGDEPAGTITAAQPGVHAVLYHSKKFEVTFDDFRKFEDYLKEEGLERQLTLAKARAGSGGKIVEQYMRCAKALIVAGAADGAAADRNFGCTLELVAESDPARDAELRVRLLYKNAPVEGVLIAAFNKAEPASKLKARTDKDGRVALTLSKSGVWLVKAVHMVPQARFIRGDWESFWASLTFERP